ncbi:MAG: matrixin family metalloprotease [Spirulinaceae cyanobacterium]
MTKYRYRWRVWGIAIATCLFIFIALPGGAQNPEIPLPPRQNHPLPPLLDQWQINSEAGDYFENIQPTAAGYLLWSQFPVQVYIDRDATECQERFRDWLNAILAAVDAWDDYFPLKVISRPENANIIWQCQRPTPRVRRDRDTLIIPVARNAEARYQIYADPPESGLLGHRIWIQLSPHQSAADTQATARHELGHGLGIWGHSPVETDVMYETQTRQNPAISERDLNTLKRIYQQPTRLGHQKN